MPVPVRLIPGCMGMFVRVFVGLLFHFERDQVQLAMPDTAFRHQEMGKSAHCFRRSAQNNAFEAVFVIEMGVQGGNGQVVMIVLQLHQTFGQRPLVVVIHVTEVGDTIRSLILLEPVVFKLAAQQVAYRLGTVAVAAFSDQLVELLRQIFVQGNGEPFHADASGTMCECGIIPCAAGNLKLGKRSVLGPS